MDWWLSSTATDEAWRTAKSLLLRLQSAGVRGRALLSYERVLVDVQKASQDRVEKSLPLKWTALAVCQGNDVIKRMSLVNEDRADVEHPALRSWANDTIFVNSGTRRAKSVVILRGIPGSGKSSLGRQLKAMCDAEGLLCVICSADQYFETARGYEFNPSRLADAHRHCERTFRAALYDHQVDVVVIDNTHTRQWEFQTVEAIALEQPGVRLHLLEMRCDNMTTCRRMAQRNSHGVDVEKVIQMFERWEHDNRAVVFYPSFDDTPAAPLPSMVHGHFSAPQAAQY
ncbi:TPA: hypothetical protein N0F65_005689 [Lagenidium giganteum]|uniref:2',3'-cyclic-nucleotide 3'-phosphodiesterase n=1 Tax=Lagenidium giganteum TaxID=4803 RepID=A0AAV2ZEV2_9STRA|nr:TPA: hypothetical protein N0F65_005689 [Lagenidium giganteum]